MQPIPSLYPEQPESPCNLHRLVSAHAPYEAGCISYSNACLVIHIHESGNTPTDGRPVYKILLQDHIRSRHAHLQFHRQHSFSCHQIFQPALPVAPCDVLAMRQSADCCTGIAGGDLISAFFFPGVSCWISAVSRSGRY